MARGESILCSKYDLVDGAAKSIESGEAGGYDHRQRRHQLDRCIANNLNYETVYCWVYKLDLSLFLSTIIVLYR